MSVDFYSPDRALRPVDVGSTNNQITVIEDPNGSADTNTVTIDQSSSFANDTVYLAVSAIEPATIGNIVTLLDDYRVATLYGYIAAALTSGSPNGLDYRFQSATPANSDLINSGLKLDTTGGTTELQYDWGTTTLSLRYFGFREGGYLNEPIGTSITGPVSRWGMWQSPFEAQDKRSKLDLTTFGGESQDPSSTTYSWTVGRRARRRKYIDVTSPHVFPYDRADRSTLYEEAGLPDGDSNNNLQEFWKLAHAVHEQRIVVQENEGESDLTLGEGGDKPLSVGKIVDFGTYDPPEDTDREYSGEGYDLYLDLNLVAPRKYDDSQTRYKH